ncbi:MAG: lipopolysaccharide heptosyltransferase I [Rhizobacter sp.]
MRVLIVKLSSLGDVVHALPVVHDIHAAYPDAVIDWVVEPAFAPLLRRVRGVAEIIEIPLRTWTRQWWTGSVRQQLRVFVARLRRQRYDAVIDLQGLTKSALVARLAKGMRYGLANRTEGASHEWPARWLTDRAIRIEPHIHALDRSRELAARALGYEVRGAPDFGLHVGVQSGLETGPQGAPAPATVLFVHGTSRGDKLWPEADWVELGRRLLGDGWRIALPQSGAIEQARAARIAAALGPAAEVWPVLDLGAVIDRMAEVQAIIGVDSGLSHIAVALGLPHVQLYNHPTAWRTGPQPAHGHRHQVSIEGRPAPTVDAVWAAWQQVRSAA